MDKDQGKDKNQYQEQMKQVLNKINTEENAKLENLNKNQEYEIPDDEIIPL